MELGGIRQRQAPRVFLISTTHGGEAHALAAARAVLHVYQSNNVLAYHRNLVQRVKRGFLDAIESHKLTGSIEVHASDWRIVTVCRDADGEVSLPLRTLLLQEMIGRGVLFQGIFLPCYSHTDADVTQIVNAFSASARIYREALQYGVEKFLVGPPTRPVFRKYNGCEQVCPSAPCPLESKCLDNRKASC
jgi:glutamate-1-semialdehyde aminotransferase